ncbi:MAG: LUD domain-containing protein [Candidatus Geothermarchaeales archaeon]
MSVEHAEFLRHYKRYKGDLYKALKNRFIRLALRRGVATMRRNTAIAFERFPDVEEKRVKLREVKERILEHLDEVVVQTMESVDRMGGHAYYAKTPSDALKTIEKIVGSGKLVVKGKSMTSEEIDLNEHLEEWGNTVYETDLGAFIVQVLRGRPMHITSPAIHIPREEVARVFSEISGKNMAPDIPRLAAFAREHLRKKFFDADIGVSGANAVIAETGSIYLIENEGNIRFATNAPPVYIAIAGIEKILPTLSDGMLLVEVVSRYAGYAAPSFVSIISGPSKSGDIEKTPVVGVHGPREVHLILLDGGRGEVAKDPVLRQALLCVRCGGCFYECPVYALTAGYFGHKYLGGIGVPWTAFVCGGLDKAAPMAFTCSLCGKCVKHCPMEIDVPAMVAKLREMCAIKGYLPPYVGEMVENVLTKGTPY